MTQLLLPIIYLAFISLGLPDSLLGTEKGYGKKPMEMFLIKKL